MKYAELHCASAFSFLEGASQPEDLVARAAELELPAVALVDRNGVYGAPRFWKAATEAGIKPLVGAEIVSALGSWEVETSYNAYNTEPDSNENITVTFSIEDPKDGTYWMPVNAGEPYYFVVRYYNPDVS